MATPDPHDPWANPNPNNPTYDASHDLGCDLCGHPGTGYTIAAGYCCHTNGAIELDICAACHTHINTRWEVTK